MDDVEHAVDDVEATQPSTQPAGPATPPAGDDDAVRDPEAAARSREAAGYRTKLREAETVIGSMRAEVDRLHRAEAERLAGALSTPGDLWLVADLADLRDDSGRIDASKVRERVSEVLTDRPAWRREGSGFDGGARTTPTVKRSPGLADLLKPGSR